MQVGVTNAWGCGAMSNDWMGAGWKMTVLRGVIGIGFGVVAMFSPVATVVALALLWGVWAVIDGVGEIAHAFTPGAQGRFWLILMGLISLAAGGFAILSPNVAAVTLTWVLGIWLVARGIFELGGAFASSATTPRWLLAIGGVLSIVLGLLFVANPGSGAVALAVWLGVTALVWGIAFVATGLALRRASGSVTSPVAGTRHGIA